jgi:hypothetical protein
LPEFWKRYAELPLEVREAADKKYALFARAPFHSSLGLEQKAPIVTATTSIGSGSVATRHTTKSCEDRAEYRLAFPSGNPRKIVVLR